MMWCAVERAFGCICSRGPTSVKRYSSLRVVGIRCVRSADLHSVCIASSLQRGDQSEAGQ